MARAAWARQVHGPGVLEVAGPGLAGDADALWTATPGLGVVGRLEQLVESELLDLDVARESIEVRVTDRNPPLVLVQQRAALRRRGVHRRPFGGVHSHRLFHQHMLPGCDSMPAQGHVVLVGCGDD